MPSRYQGIAAAAGWKWRFAFHHHADMAPPASAAKAVRRERGRPGARMSASNFVE